VAVQTDTPAAYAGYDEDRGILGLGSIATLLMMPAYPFWSLCIFAIQILAIYGLVASGDRIAD
jgi:hypothetical protein